MKTNKKQVELANESFEKLVAAGGKPSVAEMEAEHGLAKGQLANYRSNQARLVKARATGEATVAAMVAGPGEMVRVAVAEVSMMHNSRTIFDAAEMASLKDSMRQTGGAMQPVVGSLGEDGRVELIMGERRLRAMQELAAEEPSGGYDTMTVILRSRPSRREWMAWNLMENLQRSDLRPSEVATRYEMMLAETDGVTGRPLFSQASAAEETGVDPNYVANCLAMLRAPKAVRRAVDEGRCALETGSLVGSLPTSMHERAAQEMVLRVQGPMTAAKAREWVASEYRRDLRKADFTTEETGLSGAPEEVTITLPPCLACPWWGGNRDDVGGTQAWTVCLDPRCFEAKQAAVLARDLAADGARVRMLPAAERRKVLDPATGGIAPDCGYVELARKPDGFFLHGGESGQGAAPTWKKALDGTEVETVVVFDESGRKRVLVETAVAVEGAMQGPHAALFSPAAASRFESRDERSARKSAAAELEASLLASRNKGLVSLARVLRTGMTAGSQAQVVRLAMEMLLQSIDELFLWAVLAEAMGADVVPGGMAAWLADDPGEDDLWMALVLVLQARPVRLEGCASWSVPGSPMAMICEAEGWDAGGLV